MEFIEVKIEIYIPEEYMIKLREELNKINALRAGYYDNVMSATNVTGYWRPLEGSNPYEGEVGKVCQALECKVELRCRTEYVKNAIKVIREIHPYEEPVFNVIPIVNEMFE